MKFVILALLIMATLVSSAPQYTKFEYHNGDEILRSLQSYDDKIYIIYFFSDPGYNRDLRTTNDYFKDRLRTDVLEVPSNPPVTYLYAEVDVTDTKSNGNLVSKVKADSKELKENPTASFLVMKNGKGNLIYGPTAIDSVKKALKALNTPPPAAAGAS